MNESILNVDAIHGVMRETNFTNAVDTQCHF